MVEKDFLYTKEHEWAKIQDNIATIGITDHAQDQLGEITYVELPEIGRQINSGEEAGMVESSKSASDVYAPISGKITEVNSRLQSSPELINDDCYGRGWLCKMEITDPASVAKLMDAQQYEQFLQE